MKLDVYAVPPPRVRSRFSSGVSGHTHPAQLDPRAPGRGGQVYPSHRGPSRGEQPAHTKSTNATWSRTVTSAKRRNIIPGRCSVPFTWHRSLSLLLLP